eukprot:CAMPEP_0119508362 /NCGR_PEP_ID=MMETSP1344-20130328/28003_1 /TAXON_ID=236787 /ORGANISM="Florenciella parvula, Strain CCMP2471" /LENGTH=89 /DNA_ID=CAMNT_0007545099 /DNA_START=51 /DNA_END=317 /DNA_ORIENTATION=-
MAPNATALYMTAADVYELMHDMSSAASHLRYAVRLTEGSQEVRYRLAKVLTLRARGWIAQGMFDRASTDFAEATKLKPMDGQLWIMLAM